MDREEIREKVYDCSCGVLATVIDLVLLAIIYGFEVSTAGYGSPKVWRAADEAFEKASELAIDKETIKRAIYKATHKKWIRRQKKGRLYWQITEEGKKRFGSIVPQYDEKRIWDGRLFLITYDIPETKRNDREVLREYLKKIGCGMLQASVWLTLYNPTGVLKDFIKERDLAGAVIVSDIGKDGSIGEEDLDDLISRIYKLEDLNERYERFIYEVKRGELGKAQIVFKFLSILADDPQLPFELLPYNWQGKKAYNIFPKKKAAAI